MSDETAVPHSSDGIFEKILAHIAKEDMVNDRMAQIEIDLRPIKRLYWAIVGSGGVAGLLLLVVLVIYNLDRAEVKENRADLKTMVEVVHKQATTLERLIEKVAGMDGAMKKDSEELVRHIDKDDRLHEKGFR